MKTEFGPRSRYQLRVIIPEAPILSVVKGAAYFGLTHDYIKGRVLQRTYGYIVTKREADARASGVSEEYIKKKKYFHKQRKEWYVPSCFDVLAAKNEQILYGIVKTALGQRGSIKTRTVMNLIYCSDKVNPLIESDGRLLGKMELKWDKSDMDLGITTEFNFFDTTIRAQTYKASDSLNKKFVPLNYKK